MISVEFRQEKTGSSVAVVTVGDPATIPLVGDMVFVPDAETPWVYAYLRVMGRQFFYDQLGALTMVSLACECGPAEHAPEPAFQTPFQDSSRKSSIAARAATDDPDETAWLPGRE
jgi:hypothetical protein